MKKFGACVGLSLILNGLIVATGIAAESPAPAGKQSTQSQHAFLGVGIESLHPSMSSHLGAVLEKGTGILVAQVTPGSPAEKAGLKPDDILTKFDDQRLYSPEQLAQLVANDQAGRTADLTFVREGKTQTAKATLESQANSPAPPRMGRTHHPFNERVWRGMTTGGDDSHWTQFDSMTLTRTDNNRFKAEIKFRDDQGKTDSRTFEGTRDEIRRDILAEKQLPADERQHLLHALNLTSNETLNGPASWMVPNDGLWNWGWSPPGVF